MDRGDGDVLASMVFLFVFRVATGHIDSGWWLDYCAGGRSCRLHYITWAVLFRFSLVLCFGCWLR